MMDVRRSDLPLVTLEPRTTTEVSRAHVACQSYLVEDAEGVRIEDRVVRGGYPCPDPAVWRVTYGGALTDTGATALRTKCETCADSAVDSFGYGAVTFRPL